jgi:ubiquinone biosynthesis protein
MAQTISVLYRYRIVHAALPWSRGQLDPIQLRLALEHLGGSWIKLGQMLATRFDLLPAAYCNELLKLLNQVQPFPSEQVREVIRQELGDYPERIFRHFDPTPIAAASIGQVHRAVLPTGEPVAVKVQRPDARQVFASDIDLMYSLSGLFGRTGLFGATSGRWVIDEFAKWTADELDYLVEARQGIRLRQNATGDPLQCVARIWGGYCTSRVLTLDLVVGIPLIEIVYAVRDRDRQYLDRLREGGHDLRRIVRHLDWNMLNQMHVFGFFHADMHPANLFVLPGDAIGYVDFGIVGKLSGEMRQSMTRYAWLLFEGESDRAVAELTRWVSPASFARVGAARPELVQVHDEYMAKVNTAGQIPANGAGMKFAEGILEIARRRGIEFAPNVVTYFRTLITADALRFELAPGYDLPWHVQLFFNRLIAQEAREGIRPRSVVTTAYDIALRADRVFEAAESQLVTAGALEARLFSIQSRVTTYSRRLAAAAVLILAGILLLHFVDTEPASRTAPFLPSFVATWLRWIVFGVLVVIVLGFIIDAFHLRKVPQEANGDQPTTTQRLPPTSG